jgi:hypothetical protein
LSESLQPRLAAVCDLSVASVREWAGLHMYDGVVQDLSPAGVSAGLTRLGGPPLEDAHDEAHLAAFESGLRVAFDEVGMHRRNPLVHLQGLDLACYDRTYAPADQRADGRRRHLAAWPDAVDAAVESLTEVPAPVAAALLPAAQGLAAGVDAGAGTVEVAALAAHARLVDHLRGLAGSGTPVTALGGAALAALMGAPEGVPVDLETLAGRADDERGRMTALLEEACGHLGPGRPVEEVIVELLRDHPDADGVLAEDRLRSAARR